MRMLWMAMVVGVLGAQAPDARQALSMARPLDAEISPDGRRVAYVLSRTNWEDNANESDIYVAAVSGGEPVRLTAQRKSASGPVWSPDSKRVAFVSNRDGKQQIYVIPVEGGEAMPLTAHATDVSGLVWAGEWIYFLAPEEESAVRKEQKKKYGEVVVVDEQYTMTHVWRVRASETPKQKAERVTEGDFHVQSFAVARDGRQVAMVTKKNPDLSTEGAKLEVLTIEGRQRRTLSETRSSYGRVLWSPDGSEIAYTTPGEGEDSYYANAVAMVRAIAGGAERRVSGNVDEMAQLVAWTGEGILFLARKKTAMGVYLADPAGAGARELRLEEGWMLTQVSVSADWRMAAFVGASRGENYEVRVSPTTQWAPRTLTKLREQWNGFRPARRETVRWKSKDGAEIEGVLLKPVDFDPARKYPLLVVVHGGPTGIDVPYLAPDNYYPVEQFVARGALVLRPNYRGSAGYGAAFRALNVRNLGVGDAWDVLSGIDALASQGIVDRDRVGCMGWSQGGYISAFLATAHSERFRALSVGAGISNWVTYYVNTDIHPFTRQYLKATPWKDMEVYRKTSPMTYIEQAKKPVLIQHGEQDRRVPPPNAFELYQGLKDVGVEARLVLYRGFGHGINKPKEAMHVMEENLRWFGRHVFGDATTGQ